MTLAFRLLRRLLIRLNGFAAGAMMAVVFSLVFINAFSRYTLGKSITWGGDVAIYAMIFGIMFGAALAYLQDGHVRFSVLVNLLPARWNAWNLLLIDFLVMLVGIGLAVSGYEFVASRGGRDSPSTGLPMWLFQSATLIGGVLLTLSALTMIGARLTARTEAEADR